MTKPEDALGKLKDTWAILEDKLAGYTLAKLKDKLDRVQ